MAGDNLRVTAVSPGDGVIEAVELDAPNHFVVGVQWHPERTTAQSAFSRAIFGAFVRQRRLAAPRKGAVRRRADRWNGKGHWSQVECAVGEGRNRAAGRADVGEIRGLSFAYSSLECATESDLGADRRCHIIHTLSGIVLRAQGRSPTRFGHC